MQLESQTKGIIGNVSITKTNIAGDILEKIYIPNLVVSLGKTFIASRMVGTVANIMSHMALGSSSTGAVAGDATLGTELGRAVLTSATSANNIVTYTATFAAGVGTGSIQEAGIFNASSGGTLLCRTTFPVVSKQASDVIAVSWTITVN